MNSLKARELVERYFSPHQEPASIVGSGLIALDVVVNDANPLHPILQTGGSCGNLLCIMAFLGWQAYPLARFNQQRAAQHVMEDFRHWGVRTDHVFLEPVVDVPLVVHSISHNSAGDSFHRFTWNCPSCGSWLPAYQPLTLAVTHLLLKKMPPPQVFFMDRVSPANVLMAREFRNMGALIVFEPTGVGDSRLFLEALELTHLLKYSHERMRKVREIQEATVPLLEIETLGREGLRYRSRLPLFADHAWHRLESFPVSQVKDAAGAGDWCAAALIHGIGFHGISGLNELEEEEWRDLLHFAQALSAWNCGFEGARGGMYSQDRATIYKSLLEILSGTAPLLERQTEVADEIKELFHQVCPHCRALHEYGRPCADRGDYSS
jgi:sugar/nucleoside kinase (ribokinase family)